ncbi:MAG: hypothetical protein KKA84_16000 [Bacteroidetes bacterium]|nr:hypothetical protein [Bacteroidota bacterium]
MKNMYFILLVIVLILGILFAGACNENKEDLIKAAQEGIQQASQDLKDAHAEYDKDWQKFKNDAELKILDNERKIAEFKVEIKTAGKKFKVKYEKQVAILEQKNIDLKKKISEYKYEGKNKWEEFKKEFNDDVDIVAKALNEIFETND